MFDNTGRTVLLFGSAFIIGRVEIFDRSNLTGGFVTGIFGGVGTRNVYISFEAISNDSVIEFDVNIFAEPPIPNDFFAGNLTSNSNLVHRERVTTEPEETFLRFDWSGPYVITKIEAFDQSAGLGGELILVQGGLNTSEVIMYFTPLWQLLQIDFIINIYGERLSESNS